MTTTDPEDSGAATDQVLFEGRLITVGRMPGGWEMVRKAPAVCVLAVRDGQVLGVEQPRPVIGTVTWELPAGIIDPGETPEQTALRELAEETQLTGRLEFLTSFYSSPGFTDEHTSLFLASDLEPAPGEPDETERITVRWRPLDELRAELLSGRLATSASTATGLMYAFSLP